MTRKVASQSRTYRRIVRNRDTSEIAGLNKAMNKFRPLVVGNGLPIDSALCIGIHKAIFSKGAYKESAGKYRKIDVKLSKSQHDPPHWSNVPGEMFEFNKMMDAVIPKLTGKVGDLPNVVLVAAIAQHRIAWVHPFEQGNGRIARIIAALIIEKFGWPHIDTDMVFRERQHYLSAIQQADKGDIVPLAQILFGEINMKLADHRQQVLKVLPRLKSVKEHKKHKK